MTEQDPPIGTIAWRDLTVEDAEGMRRFYQNVVGWASQGIDMGGFSDFNMMPPGSDEPIAGICHAREGNADLPPQWLIYFVVADADAAAVLCRRAGGEVIAGPRRLGGGRFCVIRDPAGAVCALYSPASDKANQPTVAAR